MRAGAALLAGLLAAGCAATPDAPSSASSQPAPRAGLRTIVLQNADFESDPLPQSRCAPRWSCTMHANPDSFRFVVDATNPASGKRSLLIEPAAHKEPWALATQVVADMASLHGARVRLSLAVRTEGVVGKGGGPVAIAQYSHGGQLGHWQAQEVGTSGWKRMQVEFVVPKDTGLLEVGAIFEGTGRLWVDDARLEVLELAK